MTVSPDVAQFVHERARKRCEYCKMHQSLQGATFHIEHVIPVSRGGESDVQNLALACPSCNLHKSNRVSASLSGSSELIPLYHPRTDNWPDHFEWESYQISGRTEVSLATIDALAMNQQRRQEIRKAEESFGLFPPSI